MFACSHQDFITVELNCQHLNAPSIRNTHLQYLPTGGNVRLADVLGCSLRWSNLHLRHRLHVKTTVKKGR